MCMLVLSRDYASPSVVCALTCRATILVRLTGADVGFSPLVPLISAELRSCYVSEHC